MKNASPRKLALSSAVTITLFLVLFLIIIDYVLKYSFPVLVYALLSLSLLAVSFFLFYYILNHFIYNKIRLIYKTIRDMKLPREQRREKPFRSNDIILEANEEVEAWARDKKKEIDDLKRMEAYRREFLGNVSHELKTPIFNIQGYVLTLLDGGLDDPQINRDYLLRTEQSIDRMISIVEDLEDIAKLEAGEAKLRYSHFDMTVLVRALFEQLEMEAAEKQVRLTFGRHNAYPVMVFADRQKIQQVISNLIVNAIKYNKEGGHVKVSFFDMDKHILTEVTDEGEGIAREELLRVFERFYRGEKSRSRNGGGGSGLGLAIVKHIIEAHEQTINVRSTPGVGTTFAFTLKKGKAVR